MLCRLCVLAVLLACQGHFHPASRILCVCRAGPYTPSGGALRYMCLFFWEPCWFMPGGCGCVYQSYQHQALKGIFGTNLLVRWMLSFYRSCACCGHTSCLCWLLAAPASLRAKATHPFSVCTCTTNEKGHITTVPPCKVMQGAMLEGLSKIETTHPHQ
jgi:hypothetical protein